MIRFTLLCLGKVRDPHLAALCEQYLRRVRRYGRLRVQEVREVPCSDTRVAVEREAQALMKKLEPTSLHVTLHRKGRAFDSIQFSHWLQEQAGRGRSDLTFVIGGSYGLTPEFLERSDMLLSLSSMTLTHEMTRLLLLEQLYRAMTIWRGEPYHHGS